MKMVEILRGIFKKKKKNKVGEQGDGRLVDRRETDAAGKEALPRREGDAEDQFWFICGDLSRASRAVSSYISVLATHLSFILAGYCTFAFEEFRSLVNSLADFLRLALSCALNFTYCSL